DWGKAAFARPPSISTGALSDFGCSAAPAPAPTAGPQVQVSPGEVRVANERMERTWSRKPFRTEQLRDPRNGRVWSQNSADFALSIDGVEIASDKFDVSGEPQVQHLPNGAVRVTFRLVPSGFG